MTNSGNSKSALAVVVVVIFFLLGASGGYFLGRSGQTPSLLVKATPQGGAAFYNRVVKAISETVEGEIKEIAGEQVVLQDGDDTLSFKVPATARINLIRLPPAPKPEEATKSGTETPRPPVNEEISFGELKVGQRLTAMLSATPEGLIAYSLTVLVEEK